jgi:HK97 gp10 family phage protein
MKNLRSILTKHNVNEIRKVLRRGAMILVEEAKRRVTVEDGGRLRNSIQIMPKWSKDPAGIYVAPRVRRRFTAKTSQKVKDANPFYAHFTEYGTDPHNLGYKGKYTTGKGAQHPGAKKAPYMRPALDAKAQQVINTMSEDLAKYIETKK